MTVDEIRARWAGTVGELLPFKRWLELQVAAPTDIDYLLTENERLRVALEPFRIRAEEVQHRGDGSIVLIHTTAGELKEVLRALIAPQPDNAIQTQSVSNSDAIATEKE